jgi:diguanylate cyclase
MSRLLNDLLDLSRVTTGKFTLERQIVEMSDLVSDAIETCRHSVDARSQRLSVHKPSCALEVNGDPARLTQIFVNLVDNASKYTPDNGEINLVIEVVDDAIVLTLSDTGIGITAGALPDVFEPFVQDAQAIAFNDAGLGIGLTVVRELVEAHSGTVIARSAGSGLGSQFVVTLPLARST